MVQQQVLAYVRLASTSTPFRSPPLVLPWFFVAESQGRSRLSAVRDEVARSIPTVRSVAVKNVSKEDASGIIGALIPRKLPLWRVAPNLVSLLLSDLSGHLDGGDETAGAHPVRTIGRAMKEFNQLPALQELILLNCQALRADVEPLAAALKKGNAPQLRLFNYGSNQQWGTPESSTNLLLGALACGVLPRHRLQVLSFADNWSFVDASLTYLRAALKACPGLRMLNIDSSKGPVSEVLELASAISTGDLPRLEYVCLSVPAVVPNNDPRQAIDILTRAAASKVPPVMLDIRWGS